MQTKKKRKHLAVYFDGGYFDSYGVNVNNYHEAIHAIVIAIVGGGKKKSAKIAIATYGG